MGTFLRHSVEVVYRIFLIYKNKADFSIPLDVQTLNAFSLSRQQLHLANSRAQLCIMSGIPFSLYAATIAWNRTYIHNRLPSFTLLTKNIQQFVTSDR